MLRPCKSHTAHTKCRCWTVNGCVKLSRRNNPDYIIPEIEAIATDTLLELEAEGYHVVPTAKAAKLTMNREGIRRLAAEELGLPTSPYRFASTRAEFTEAVREVGIPVRSETGAELFGHGPKRDPHLEEDVERAWYVSQHEGRTGSGRVIVEGFVPFDYEITQLTVRMPGGTSFLEPIGHYQEDGDYRESWQPQPMTPALKEQAQFIAGKVTDALDGWGIFGVELFIRGDQVIFSEVSPRPHDTGMVTMISQDLSQFALHVRAILGLPIPNVAFHGPSASRAIVVEGDTDRVEFANLENVLSEPDTQMRIFGKPEVKGHRRMAVLLAGAKIFPKHAKRPVVPMPNCKSMCTTGSSCPARVGSANIE